MDNETYNELEEVYAKMDKAIKKYIGKRCPGFNFNCASCKLHNIYEKFKIDLANEVGGN